MNEGQILETNLGWAARGLGKQIGQAAEAARAKNQTTELRKKLQQIYPATQYNTALKAMDDSQLVEQAGLLARGVPMATPVFDGAKEADVVSLLAEAGLSDTGQEWLTDGRTGEVFDRPVTVGYIYMLKLHHLVDDKIHARSIGTFAGYPAAAGRQGPVWRPALWRDGGLGPRSLWRGLYLAGNADREIR